MTLLKRVFMLNFRFEGRMLTIAKKNTECSDSRWGLWVKFCGKNEECFKHYSTFNVSPYNQNIINLIENYILLKQKAMCNFLLCTVENILIFRCVAKCKIWKWFSPWSSLINYQFCATNTFPKNESKPLLFIGVLAGCMGTLGKPSSDA